MLLEHCGGHPKILETCLALYMQKTGFSTGDLVDELTTLPYIWRKLVPYSEDEDKSQKMCHLLNRDDLGPAPPYIFDAFLRTLYWKNFLKRSSSNNRLTWRGNALQIACKRILGCEENEHESSKIMDDIFITHLAINNVRHLKDIAIPLSKEGRKHLILTGKNGSGKTSVLECLKTYLGRWEEKKETPGREEISLQFNIEPGDRFLDPGNFVIAFYSARRKADYLVPKTIKKLKLKESYKIDEQPGREFIQYIVNLSADKSFAKEKFDQLAVEKIEKWFALFEELLKDIFEDPEFRIEFDSKNYNYRLIQDAGKVFDFNTMADGYSAIIDIVTDLILRMETHRTTSYDLQGIVLIDEVEAHLHIDLQKKILPFLTSFFPKIQFIVSTHSPFVLNSIEDSVIYDLERNMLLSDLSGYSYEGIVEGYFDNDKYSREAKEKIRLYQQLVGRENRTEAEHVQMMELRMYLNEIPAALAPELKIRFQEIEAERKTKQKRQKER
jgi:AAA15 family ATPase/GTPase